MVKLGHQGHQDSCEYLPAELPLIPAALRVGRYILPCSCRRFYRSSNAPTSPIRICHLPSYALQTHCGCLTIHASRSTRHDVPLTTIRLSKLTPYNSAQYAKHANHAHQHSSCHESADSFDNLLHISLWSGYMEHHLWVVDRL